MSAVDDFTTWDIWTAIGLGLYGPDEAARRTAQAKLASCVVCGERATDGFLSALAPAPPNPRPIHQRCRTS